MNRSRNKNVVILGGNGYIGNSIIEKWLERGTYGIFFYLSFRERTNVKTECLLFESRCN